MHTVVEQQHECGGFISNSKASTWVGAREHVHHDARTDIVEHQRYAVVRRTIQTRFKQPAPRMQIEGEANVTYRKTGNAPPNFLPSQSHSACVHPAHFVCPLLGGLFPRQWQT